MGQRSLIFKKDSQISRICIRIVVVYGRLRSEGAMTNTESAKSKVCVETHEAFALESVLVNTLISHLGAETSPFGNMAIAPEFYYQTGRADLVGIGEDNSVIAFEAKLEKWRTAVHQAFRNTSFADYSFVVLPAKIARRAMASEGEFERRKVGLISVTPCGFEILIEHKTERVLRPRLREKAVQFITETRSAEPPST